MNIFNVYGRLLLTISPERAHELAILALKVGISGEKAEIETPVLATNCAGIRFPNPLGIAAGFDKNAEVFSPLLALGVGFTEVGTVTPYSQPGNPKPRVFRIMEKKAVINRLGFNNEGHAATYARLTAEYERPGSRIVGVNVGANKDSSDRISDYVKGVELFAPVASYLTINISSPNTPGLRDLQKGEDLERLLSECVAARDNSLNDDQVSLPLFLKIAPDLSEEALRYVVAQAVAQGVDGMIISNTTLSRRGVEHSPVSKEAGGLSGPPVFEQSTIMLAKVFQMTDGTMPLIGVGGIASAADAFTKIKAGATLLQLYTGLIYGGPALIGKILRGLVAEVEASGFQSIEEARGIDAASWAEKPLLSPS